MTTIDLQAQQDRVERNLRAVMLVVCVAVAVVAVVDLAGWWVHRPALLGMFSTYATMKPNTAVMVLLLASGLWFTRSESEGPRRGHALCWLALTLSGLTLLEYVTKYNLGLDQMLVRVPMESSGDPAGRMAVGTALAGGLIAAGLLVLDRFRTWSRVLLGTAGLIALSALIGYVFNAGPLRGVRLLRSMSVRTAVVLFALQAAAFLLRPRQEPVHSLLAALRTRRTSFLFVLGTCLLPVVTGWPVAWMYRHGWIDATFSLALLIVLLIASQALLILQNNRSLYVMEKKREALERARVLLSDENERNYAASRTSAQKAEENEDLYRLISDTVPAYIVYLDTELRYLRVNRTCCEWLGRPAEEIEGRTLEEALGPSSANVRSRLEAALGGTPQHYETVFTIRGKERTVSLSYAPDYDAAGTVRGVVVHGSDITESRRAEQVSRVKAERLRAAQKASDMAAWEWDLRTNRLNWDEDSRLLYGRPLAELENLDDVLSYVHPEDSAALGEALQPALRGTGEFNSEFRVIWPDGSVHWLLGRGRSQLDEQGKPVRIAGVNLDTTFRHQTEAALMQTEKLAAVGRLASTIAHELNNPLESVTNLLYLAQGTTDKDELRNYLNLAESELQRASAIASQTLRFYRQATGPTFVSPETLLESVLGLHQSRLMNARVAVEVRHAKSAPMQCFEGEIRQVLNNLIGNAIDAMPHGGRLLVRSHAATNATGERGLAMVVADNGGGIDTATLQKLFTPFFTTKGDSGTGLGLWVSQEIVKRHKGSLTVWSRRGAGTVFRMFLPAVAAAR